MAEIKITVDLEKKAITAIDYPKPTELNPIDVAQIILSSANQVLRDIKVAVIPAKKVIAAKSRIITPGARIN